MNEVGITGQEMVLGKAIATARKNAGLTQQDLCAKATLSYSTLAKIERGAIKTPSVFTVASIAHATGTTVEQLVGASPAPTPTLPSKSYKTSKSGVTFVYFDINGVMVRFFQGAFTAIAAETGASPDTIEASFWHYNDALCRGELELSEFDRIMAEKLNKPDFSWKQYYMASISAIEETHECIIWASQYYRVGLLSNIIPGFLRELIERGLLPDIAYDVIVDSSEVGSIKPELAIYEYAQKHAGVNANEILFIDDSRTNLMAAERLGWHVMWFDDFKPGESQNRIRKSLEFNEQ